MWCQSENPYVCFGAKPTKRACKDEGKHENGRTREGRFQKERVGMRGYSREKRGQQK